jgi:hypothetical protein
MPRRMLRSSPGRSEGSGRLSRIATVPCPGRRTALARKPFRRRTPCHSCRSDAGRRSRHGRRRCSRRSRAGIVRRTMSSQIPCRAWCRHRRSTPVRRPSRAILPCSDVRTRRSWRDRSSAACSSLSSTRSRAGSCPGSRCNGSWCRAAGRRRRSMLSRAGMRPRIVGSSRTCRSRCSGPRRSQLAADRGRCNPPRRRYGPARIGARMSRSACGHGRGRRSPPGWSTVKAPAGRQCCRRAGPGPLTR